MNKYLLFSLICLTSSILLFGFAAFFAGTAEAFGDAQGGGPFDVAIHGFPIWILCLILLVGAFVFGFAYWGNAEKS